MLALVVLILAFIGILTLTEYKPADEETVEIADGNSTQESIHVGDSLRVVTWNIGYGALGDNADFFMDGGKGVRTADLQRTQENINSMIEGLQQLKPDIAFLQEVDIQSDRSHHLNEVEAFRASFADMSSTFAANYKVLFVPYPIPPIGHVDGGIATFSRFSISSAQRIQLPCPFSWPIRLGNLKRCLLVSRIPVEGTGKELVAVNLHLEAYDDGEGKIAQTQQLASFLQAEILTRSFPVQMMVLTLSGKDYGHLESSMKMRLPIIFRF